MVWKERKDAYRESEWAIDYHNTVIPVHSTEIPVYIDKRAIDLYKESIGLMYTIHGSQIRRNFALSFFLSFGHFPSCRKNNLNKRKSVLLKK